MPGAQLTSRLEGICGSEHVLTHPHALATYRSDGLAQYRQTPLAAVLPGTAAEVQKVVRACFEAGVQLDLHLRELGRPLPIHHPVELLWRSISAGERS